ncbi:putative repeat protein (TIGR01451 family) [Variovorax boronicumulans]|uniref:Repeat protein (TIGR01451 family) n=1 Tax=Variovorax boronicumulans TaxID=436515 RepID=A0AAW8DTV9_9BURK|nr:hypothetical protein [Variovorax boronicumulans]MDP9877691.1 putative repeat protein (TIGR01451 family) [Variovorax boronicumulans]MDP9922975.1 putative repeat protein (TIGR01451 family) [Variovorax boronicumulans]
MSSISSAPQRAHLPRQGQKNATRWHVRGAVVLSLFCGAWMSAVAQPAGTKASVAVRPAAAAAVVVELTQHKVTKNEKGEEQLLDAASVKPGDVIEYRATYTNKSAKAVTGLVGDLPIPQGLEYLPRSAKPGASLVKAAADDGVFGAEPLVRALPGGKTEPLPYSQYRALRWALGQLPAGGVTAVSARAKVEVVVPKAPLTQAAVQVIPGTTAPPASKP